MIEFSDQTIIECQGSFNCVSEKMYPETWMIESKCLIKCDFVVAYYILHLWSDGKVVIIETEHPPVTDVSDDDLRELRQWCSSNGWQDLFIHSNLLQDARHFEFWLRMYRSGIVNNDMLKKHDEEEMLRFSKIQRKVKGEEDD